MKILGTFGDMLGFVVAKRIYKPYIIIPLFLYACVMYRILEGTCNGGGAKKGGNRVTMFSDETSSSLASVQNGVRASNLGNSNVTNYLLNLAKEYQGIERQRKHIMASLQRVLHQATFDNESDDIQKSIKRHIEQNEKPLYYNHVHNDDRNLLTQQWAVRHPDYIITCENVDEVQLKAKIGHGVSKQTFRAEFRGIQIAVKMVTRHQREVKACIEQLNATDPDITTLRSRCFVFSTMKLMKEILLLQQLQHPGFVRLLGYCIRNEDSDTTDLSERGIVSVYELGSRLTEYTIQTLPWQQKLKHSRELAEFLHYLEFSPLGSLRIRDFKLEHFLLVNGSIKMIDLDDVDNLEPSCSIYVSVDAQLEMGGGGAGAGKGCEFELPCQKGMCIGFNAKQNMKFMNRIFFKNLLFPTVFPRELVAECGSLLAELDSDSLTAAMLVFRLENLQQLSRYLID